MRIPGILLGLLGSLWACTAQAQMGPPNPTLCNQTATFSGVATNTQLVAAVTGKIIYVCGWHITNSAASGTFLFTTGQGVLCATNTVNVTPALTVTSTAPSSDHIEFAAWSAPLTSTNPPVPSAVCVTPSVTTISGVLYYSQY
jgi:hypothetical protein